MANGIYLQIEQYIHNQLSQAGIRLRPKVIDERIKEVYPKRNITNKVESYIDQYKKTFKSLRWIILAGFGGQLFWHKSIPHLIFQISINFIYQWMR